MCNMAFEQMRIRPSRFDSVLSEHCGEIKSPAECRKKVVLISVKQEGAWVGQYKQPPW